MLFASCETERVRDGSEKESVVTIRGLLLSAIPRVETARRRSSGSTATRLREWRLLLDVCSGPLLWAAQVWRGAPPGFDLHLG